MDNIIKFQDINSPDTHLTYKDDNGAIWNKYSASYFDGDREFVFEISATSFEDAERRLKLPMKINGIILTER